MPVEIVGRRILVAEDDEKVLELIVTRLASAGYRTLGARDGRKALSLVADFRPDGIVLDINMPQLDGFGVLRALRFNPETMAIPTLVLTARHGSEDVAAAIRLGAKDFLAKPFDDADLLARVARLTHQRRPGAAPPDDPEEDNAIRI